MERVELKIYYIEEKVTKLRCTVNKWKFQDTMMGEQFITFNITSELPIDFAVGDFCTFRGETYTLNYVPSVTQKARTKERQDSFNYENVKFESFQEELTRCIMLDITPTTGDYVAALGTNYTGSSRFQLFCGETSTNGSTLTAVCALAAKMQANLDRMFPTNGWKIFVDTRTTYLNSAGDSVLVTHTEDKLLSFDNTTVAKALEEVHNTFNLDYCIRGRSIYIGYNLKNLTSDNDNETFAFGYGKGYPTRENQNKALFQIKRIANSQQKVVTRLRALGSTKNMPYRYYNRKYNLSQSLFPTNLQLPDTFETPNVKAANNALRDITLRAVKGDTNDAYIDKNDDAESCSEGIREDSARWDGSNGDLQEIYPTIEEATYGELRSALVQDQDGQTGSGSFPNYGSSERIDKLLAVGYKDNGTLVDDANKGEGILPESGISARGIPRPANIGMTYLTYNTNNRGDFTSRGNVYAGPEKTLFTIQGVAAGKYAMAPTIGSVLYGFSLSCYRDRISADVGYIITIKQKNLQTGATTTIATYTSDFQSISRGDGVLEMELPEIPDVKNGANAKVTEVMVTALSDITVTFTPIMRNIIVPNGFTDNFTLAYKVGNSSLDHTVTYDPEYNWIPLDDTDSISETFHVFIQDMGFDLQACWTDETPVVAMKSGRCVGREFEIGENIEKVTHNDKKGYMLTLKRATDSTLNTYYPSATDPIEAGDYFVLLNISMPDVYVKMAEVRLLRAATEYLADNCETKFTYQPSIDDIYLQRNYDNMVKAGTPQDSVFWRLYAGLKFTFRGIPASKDSPAPLADITIEQVSIQMGEGLTPKVELKLNDDVQQSTIQKLTTSVDRIYNGSIFSIGSGGGSASGAMAAALLSILQSEGEKLFLSKKHDDVAEGKITFNDVVTHNETLKAKKGLKVGNFNSRLLGSGALIDEEGNAEFESIYSRNFISTPEFRFNRVNVTEGEQWCTNGYGTIKEVEVIDETTGYITLKLEENDYASIAEGDICRGIYNDIAHEYETAGLDDDTELYAGNNEINVEGFGFSSKEGFFTSYFWVREMITNTKGECKFLYELRNTKTPHPCEFMRFAQYGSFTNSERRSSSYATSIGHYYEMVLDGVSTWKIKSANVVYRKGYLGNMTVTLNTGNEAELQGYGLYVQDNVYFGNAIVQLDPETLADLTESLKTYTVDFSGYVDVITVDDVGNVIGGLWTNEQDQNDNTYRAYRIHSAITVRKNGDLLVIAADDADAGDGTFKIYAQPKGCSCIIENSTIYITGINNIKDGVAGSIDDANFDYAAMRSMNSCSVDIIIDCEGNGSIVKNFPIRIKHDSQPFVGADISNEFSAVSWNTQTQSYVGLPIVFEMKMWHNNMPLDIASVNDINVTPTIANMTIEKSIVTHANGSKVARISITSLPADLSTVTELNVTCVATYSGVLYERNLVHTISRFSDTNVYSLLPSVNEIVRNPNTNTQTSNSITCSVICDSSEDKHYTVAYNDFEAHNLVLCYRKYYNNGTSDSNETIYTNQNISIDSTVSKVRFTLYGRHTNGSPNTEILHDTEEVHVIMHGLNGAGSDVLISKYKWFAQSDGVTLTNAEKESDLNYDTYGWSDTAPNRGQNQQRYYLWMTQTFRHANGTRDLWSDPVRISGENGSAGEDKKDREWIYRLNSDAGYDGTVGTANGTAVSGNNRFSTDKFIPTNWSDHPTGISEYGDTEYASWRDFDNATSKWGAFHAPIVWSHYGERGLDGDGVEYVFVRTTSENAPTITNSNDTYQGKTYLDDEYLPLTSTGARATDDPLGTTSTYRYEWVIKRSKSAAVNGVRRWEQYSGTMSLWSKYSADGESTINVYKWNTSPNTAPSISGNAYPPEGWSTTPPTRPGEGYYLWMAISIRHGDDTIDAWSVPIRISGESGTPGEDASDREWIYYRSNNESYGTAPANITIDKDGTNRTAEYIEANNNFVPLGWTDNPLGIDETHAFEYAAYRDKVRGSSSWGVFSTPILWSHYGERGMDGDGVEYVFARTNTETPPTITNNSDWIETVNGDTVTHRFTDDEFLPMTNVGRATNNPVGTDSTHKYEWVVKRTKGEAVNGKKEWLPYALGNMKLWAKYSEDGISQPSYIHAQEAWSNVASTASPTTEPTPNSGWSDSTPSNVNGYAYLWRRSRLMVLNVTTKQYEPQSSNWTYTRLNGTNGTSINPMGTVVAVKDSLSNLPTVGVSTDALAILVEDGRLYKFNGSTWTQSGVSQSSDGDCYVVSESCIYLGEDVKGHMFMYSSEAMEWIDLGQFKGENGVTYYTHIAWAEDITVTNGIPTAQIGFTTGIGDSADDGKNWIGICVNISSDDPTDFTAYKWKYIKGNPGEDSSEREWVYFRSNSSTPPSIPTQTTANKSVDGFVPTNWSNHPQGVSVSYPYEYACYRDKGRGETTWGDFVGINGSPLLWSHYGERGADGDGSEYVFIRTKENTAPEISNDSSYTDSNGKRYSLDEHLPHVNSRTDIENDNSGNSSFPYECTDDPKGTDSTWKYEWVAKRTKVLQADGKTRIWEVYSGAMSLWANWSKDGISQPSYLYSEEAWSNSTTNPNEDVQASEWNETTPTKNRTYLWRRSRQMVLNAAGTSYVPQGNGEWSYVRLSGTNGTSIDPKGSVVYVAATANELPSSDVSANDLAIVAGSAKLYKYNNGWSQVVNDSSNGDCYVVTEDCTFDGQNVKNHMFMWSSEASSWVDLGQFKGEDGLNGVTYYTHIAWADVVLFNGQNVVSATGFTIGVGQNNDQKPWMGILINQNEYDSTTPQDYKWKYLKGEPGVDASEREWIYFLSNSSTPPSIPASIGTGSVNGVATAYNNKQNNWVPQGWSDNPTGVDNSHKYEYACWRDKARGSDTWGGFQGTNGTPILWSHFGDRGTDGDGVEYVFVRTSQKIAPEIFYPNASYSDSNGKETKDDEFLPLVRVAVSCRLSGNVAQTTDGDYNVVECTDDPQGVSSEWPYEWVLKRSKSAAVGGVREWNLYEGNMALWANYSESPYMIDLTNEQSFVNCDQNGTVISSYETSGLMLFKGNSYAFTDFNILITPTNIKCNGNSSPFYLTEAQKTTAQSNGSFTLTPSVLTANSGQISIQATLKSNSNIVLSAFYKVNKNIAGQNGVIYSLLPSLNVIHKDNNGNYTDQTLTLQIKKIVGNSTIVLSTYNDIIQEGLSLNILNSSGSNSLTAMSVSVAIFVGSSSNTWGEIILQKSGTMLDRERINVVVDGDDAHEVNPNILLRTIFNNGIEFVKEAWIGNWNYIGIDGANDTVVDGRKSIRINAENAESYVDFKQDVYGVVKVGTWYTLSFNYFSTRSFNTFIFSNNSSYECIDQSAGLYIDGVFQSNVPQDGSVQWPANWQGNRHTITFKTKSTFSTSYFFIIFRAHVGGQVAICMPKLELGEVATAYMAHEDDLPGSTYYLTKNVDSIVKDCNGNFKSNSTPTITAWKRVGKNSTVRLADLVDANTGVVAEGFYILALEKNSSGTTVYTNDSRNGNPGVITCHVPYSYTVIIEVQLIKDGKVYDSFSIPIIQEQQGEAGADGVYPRDCGLFDSEITTNQKYGYAGYIYRKVGNIVIRDMVRYEIGGIMYGFMVKTQSSSTLVTAAPTSASGDGNWEATGIIQTVIANTLFGTNANIGGFMASNQRFVSSKIAYRVVYKGTYSSSTTYGETKVSGISVRQMVTYNGSLWVVRGRVTSFSGQTPAENSVFWRKPTPKEERIVETLDSYVDIFTFTIDGIENLIEKICEDDTTWNVDHNGIQTLGLIDGKRIVFDPFAREIDIYDDFGVLVTKLTGEKYNDIVGLFGDNNGHFTLSNATGTYGASNSGSMTINNTTNGTAVVGSIKKTQNGVVSEFATAAASRVTITGTLRATASKTPYANPSPISEGNNTPNQTEVTALTIDNYVSHYASISLYVRTYNDAAHNICISNRFVASAVSIGNGTIITPVNRQVDIPAGYQQIVVVYENTVYTTTTITSTETYWNIISASYDSEMWLSRLLANGFAYGSSKHNFFALLNTTRLIMQAVTTDNSMNEHGFALDEDGFKVQRKNVTGKVFPTIYYGFVTWTAKETFNLSTYYSFNGNNPTISRVASGSDGMIKLTFPSSWSDLGLGFSTAIINIVGYNDSCRNVHVSSFTNSQIIIEGNDDDSNNYTSFAIEIKYIG